MDATWPAYLILLDLITLTIFGKVYKLLSCLMFNLLQPPTTSSLLGPNILLSILFSNTYTIRKIQENQEDWN
jgi:hypothetical protein